MCYQEADAHLPVECYTYSTLTQAGMSVNVSDIVLDCSLIVDYDPRRVLAPLYPDYIGEVLFSYEPEWGFAFHEALRESGWSFERVFASFSKHHGPSVNWLYRLYYEHFNEAFCGERQPVIDSIKQWQANGKRVWALGNASREWMQQAYLTCPVLARLDGVEASYQSGLRKPDSMLYRRFLTAHNINPSTSCLLECTVYDALLACRVAPAGFVDDSCACSACCKD